MPTVGDSRTEISTPRWIITFANVIAAIHPVVPPPMMAMRLKGGPRGRWLNGCRQAGIEAAHVGRTDQWSLAVSERIDHA